MISKLRKKQFLYNTHTYNWINNLSSLFWFNWQNYVSISLKTTCNSTKKLKKIKGLIAPFRVVRIQTKLWRRVPSSNPGQVHQQSVQNQWAPNQLRRQRERCCNFEAHWDLYAALPCCTTYCRGCVNRWLMLRHR